MSFSISDAGLPVSNKLWLSNWSFHSVRKVNAGRVVNQLFSYYHFSSLNKTCKFELDGYWSMGYSQEVWSENFIFFWRASLIFLLKLQFINLYFPWSSDPSLKWSRNTFVLTIIFNSSSTLLLYVRFNKPQLMFVIIRASFYWPNN